MKPDKFRDLSVGDGFVFMLELSNPLFCGCKGPWIKTGNRTYKSVANHLHAAGRTGTVMKPLECKIGSINVTVQRRTLE